ncbi:MAG: FixH family protein [Devosia sp.]|uniref:FixH family protein n=1 Tax=Devosia sp. TaxID=1871048 RepID=UPI001A42D073|nr:FixH family protein [Devosia sp.]MBL8597317.1 FixH family protein [Devosia sp.]
MSTARPTPSKGFTGVHMLMMAVGFFGVIIAVNITMATLAMKSWTGLVVTNSYVASQEFEEKRLAHEAQRAAGWEAVLTYRPGAARLVILDGARAPIDLGDVSILLNRPVGGHDDKALAFERKADGAYEAAVELPAGLWEATVTAADTALGPFELRERMRVETAP